MTETELKLSDAKVQIALAQTHIEDKAIVRSCINSFISLARSVTFVMQAESGDKSTPLSHWYRVQMNAINTSENQRLLKFFNEQRVYSIHKGTVTLQSDLFPTLHPCFSEEGEAILASNYATDWVFDKTEDYDLPKPSSVLWLCTQYLELLEELVSRWIEERNNM